MSNNNKDLNEINNSENNDKNEMNLSVKESSSVDGSSFTDEVGNDEEIKNDKEIKNNEEMSNVDDVQEDIEDVSSYDTNDVFDEEEVASPVKTADKTEVQTSFENENEAVEEKKPKKSVGELIKASFTSRKFKSGAYSTVVSAVVIALVLIINLIVGALDLKVDLSQDSLYTLTSETEKLAKNIKDDITIYFIAGEDSANDQLKEVLNKYEKLSKHLKVEIKDPTLYPKFTSQYTTEEVSENSVIVVNDKTKTYKYVPYSDMLQYSYDSSYNQTLSGVDVEGQVTAAIQYVTSEDLPTIYSLEGHNETALGTSITSSIKKQNITMKTVNLLKEDKVPDDCSLLLINGPAYDFSEDEVTKVKDFLEAGGKAIILATYSDQDMPNFDGLLEYYGLQLNKGIVIEGDQNYYMSGNQAYLIPNIESHDITKDVSANNKAVVMPIAKGISKVDNLRSTLTVEDILTTSDDAFSKVDVNSSTTDKESGDISGPFNLGVLVTDKYNDVETKLVVYASPYLIDDSMVSYNQLGNADLFISTVNYLTEKANNLSIPVRSVEQSYLTLTSAEVSLWGTIAVFVIPAIFLGTGIIVTLRRRKR